MLKELALSFKKFAKGREGEGADILDDVVVVCAPDFAAESKGVPAFEPTQGVVQKLRSYRRVPWGSPFGPPKKQCSCHLYVRQAPLPPERPAGRVMLNFVGSSSAFGRNVKWILLNPIRTVLASEAFKGVILADGQQLAEAIAGIPESRK